MECKSPTAGIVLAAGTSSRFGKLKQLQMIEGKPLLEWTLDACLGSRLDHLFVVLGCKQEKIVQALSRTFRNPRITVVFNPDYKNGQSTSLHTGIRAAEHAYPSIMFVLGDQPCIDCVTLDVLLERFWASEKNICVPFYNNQRGNPAIFSKKFYAEISHIEGDVGARRIIDDNPSQVLSIALSRPSFFYDVDTVEDIEKMCALKKVDE